MLVWWELEFVVARLGWEWLGVLADAVFVAGVIAESRQRPKGEEYVAVVFVELA